MYGSTSIIAKTTAKIFAQGTPHVQIVNVFENSGNATDYATVLTGLESQQINYDIIVPVIPVDDAKFPLLVSHAQTYMKSLVCGQIGVTRAQAIADFEVLTLGEEQYGICYKSSAYTVGELCGATAGAIAKCSPWIPPEWANVVGINPSGYSMDDVTALENNPTGNINTIIDVAGATILSSGKSLKPDNWLDIFRTKQYLSKAIKTELINTKLNFAQRNSKIPFTPAGLNIIQGVINTVCSRAQAAGALRETSSADGITLLGYSVNMPSWSSITMGDKASRVLSGISVTAFLSGAVSSITLELVVTL